MIMTRWKAPLLFLALLSPGACGGDTDAPTGPVVDDDTPPPVTSVEVQLTATSLHIGDSVQAATVLRDSQGAILSDRVVTWASSDPNVAEVSSNGLVVGLTVGEATVTATSEGVSGSTTVDVQTPEALAYVVNRGDGTVSLVDLAKGHVVGSPIQMGSQPHGLAVTPDGSRAYVAVSALDEVWVIDVTSNSVLEDRIPVGDHPVSVAVTPDGTRAYVVNHLAATVSVIDVATNTVLGAPISAGQNPIGIAIAPDGSRAYVASWGTAQVLFLNLATNTVSGAVRPGDNAADVAVTPDGRWLYVSLGDDRVAVIDAVAVRVVGSPITVAGGQQSLDAVAVTPDGLRVLVLNTAEDQVSVIDATTNTLLGQPIQVGDNPSGIGITADGSRAYVTNRGDNSVSVIDLSTMETVGAGIPVGQTPEAVVVVR